MVFIIAEIGINHNGDIKIAKELIKIAKLSGCDAVKFQKRNVEIAYSKEVLDAQIEDLDFDQTIGSVELSDYENQRADYSLQEDTLIDDKQHDKEKR